MPVNLVESPQYFRTGVLESHFSHHNERPGRWEHCSSTERNRESKRSRARGTVWHWHWHCSLAGLAGMASGRPPWTHPFDLSHQMLESAAIAHLACDTHRTSFSLNLPLHFPSRKNCGSLCDRCLQGESFLGQASSGLWAPSRKSW